MNNCIHFFHCIAAQFKYVVEFILDVDSFMATLEPDQPNKEKGK